MKIDKFFSSSKICNRCYGVKKDLKLSDGAYDCEACGIWIYGNILDKG